MAKIMKALFVGSFDPWHAGHNSLVERTLRQIDQVVIGVSQNPDKTYTASAEQRAETIKASLQGLDLGETTRRQRTTVAINNGLTIDFAKTMGCGVIIKGVRNAADFEYEQKQAEWNKQHGGLETILLCADEELKALSSTAIRNSKNRNSI